jgi:Peptidase M15
MFCKTPSQHLKLCICLLLGFLAVAVPPPADAGSGMFSNGKNSFCTRINQIESPYRIASVFVLPHEIVEIEVLAGDRTSSFLLQDSNGRQIAGRARRWRWQAPARPGTYTLVLCRDRQAEATIIHVLVMVPFNRLKNGQLSGYLIGRYPSTAYKNLPVYNPPPGFIEVTGQDMDLQISPHFKLSQFLCKQNCGFPKYLVLKEQLVLKLELLLEKVNAQGFHCSTFNVLSGYRTPYYNQSIGNVKYSRHVYGGAADIFIDENPADNMMDDLNRDGKIDYHDALWLYHLIDGLSDEEDYRVFIGGLGWYKKNHAHGPFVHVDVRGFRARWGN